MTPRATVKTFRTWLAAIALRVRKAAGFTLLEVMVALAILGMTLTQVSLTQHVSVRAALRSKMLTFAVLLARSKMVELEDKLFTEGFSDFDDEEKGDFHDEGFKRFTYTLKVDKIELPANLNPESLKEAVAGDDEGDKSASPADKAQSGMMALGGNIMAKQFEMIRNVLEQSIRRVTLRVKWMEGDQEQGISVHAYFTDPRKVDMAAAGQLQSPIPGAPGSVPGSTPGGTAPSISGPGTTSGTQTGGIKK